MKKMLCILTALLMAGLMCVSAAAESFPQPEGGKKFETNWAIYNMTVNIFYEEEGYRVYIQSSDPVDHKGTEWEYACFYNEEKDALLSFTSSKNSYTLDPATGDIERGDYEYQDIDDENQITVFAINGEGKLTWQDGRGQDGADLEFTDIGAFEGCWRSEDGKTFAAIIWSDSELGDEYGYDVYLYDEGETSYAEYSAHGLYDPQTGKLTAAGSVTISRLNADGGYDTETIAADPAEPLELVFSDLGNGKILLEKDNGIELIYDFLSEDFQG